MCARVGLYLVELVSYPQGQRLSLLLLPRSIHSDPLLQAGLAADAYGSVTRALLEAVTPVPLKVAELHASEPHGSAVVDAPNQLPTDDSRWVPVDGDPAFAIAAYLRSWAHPRDGYVEAYKQAALREDFILWAQSPGSSGADPLRH